MKQGTRQRTVLLSLALVALIGGVVGTVYLTDWQAEPVRRDARGQVADRSAGQRRHARSAAHRTTEPTATHEVGVTSNAVHVEKVAPRDGGPHDEGGVLTVVDKESGRPLGGVRVALAPFDPYDRTWFDAMALEKAEAGLFAWLAHQGTVVETGRDGTVRIPAFDEWAMAVARHGNLIGDATLSWRDSLRGWELALRAMRQARALVVDLSGEPVGGVDVVLLRHAPLGSELLSEAVTDETDGIAILSGLEKFDTEGPYDRFTISLRAPMRTRPAVPIRIDDPPVEPVRLLLPETGTVVCNVLNRSGEPAPASAWVELAERSETDGGRTAGDAKLFAARRLVRQGRAEFAHVGIRLGLTARVATSDRTLRTVEHDFMGPSRPAESVTVDVVIGEPRPVVVGRLVDREGRPVQGVVLVAGIAGSRFALVGLSGEKCSTDADGRFRFSFDEDPGEISGRVLQIVRQVPHGDRSSAIVPLTGLKLPAAVQGGENDVGDVVLRGREPLVSGRVVGVTGVPIKGAQVGVRTKRRSVALGIDSVLTDANGSFSVLGPSSAGQRLLATAQGYFLPEPVPFEPGASDVVVVMAEAGGLAGRITPPPGFGVFMLNVEIDGDAARNHSGRPRPVDGKIDVRLDRDGSFVIDTLRPGTARLTVALEHQSATVLTIEGIRVVAGEITQDPRLEHIDLSKRLARHGVRVLSVQREPIAGATVYFRSHGHKGRWSDAVTNARGAVEVVDSGDGVDVIVTKEGHRAAQLDGVTRNCAVVLEAVPKTTVVIRLPSDLPIPESPRSLTASLKWVGPPDAPPPKGWASLDPRSPKQRPPAFDDSREVAVDVWEPGRYRVTMWVWNAGIGTISGGMLQTEPSDLVVSGDGTSVLVELDVDRESLQRLMQGD